MCPNLVFMQNESRDLNFGLVLVFFVRGVSILAIYYLLLITLQGYSIC